MRDISLEGIDTRGETMRGYRNKANKSSVIVEGVVAVADCSSSEDEAEVVILTDDEEEFYIDIKQSSINPSRYVNDRVEVTGTVYDQNGQTVMAVKRIRVLNDLEETEMVDFEERGHYDDDEDYDSWSDDGIIDHYTRYARRSRGFSD